jgi:hypothetical protein
MNSNRSISSTNTTQAKFELLMKNIVWYGVLLWLPCRIVPEYSPAITRTFAINRVIVVAISHTLSAIYCNSNESSAGTSGCIEGILLKIHSFHWSHSLHKRYQYGCDRFISKSTLMNKNVTSGCILPSISGVC